MTSKRRELADKDIKAFLEDTPLYVWREFPKPGIDRTSLLIEEVEANCDECGRARPFHASLSRGGGAGLHEVPVLRSGTTQLVFTCVSCKRSRREYHVQHVLTDEMIRIQKYGELPRGTIPRDRVLQKFLKDDLDNYEKGVACLSHEYGVAAFAYFRRIVESNINRLLDLVEEDVQATGGDSESLDAISKLRPESPMSDKIRIANLALPNHLKPDGTNPLGRLYQVLSEGVHSLTDVDCLQKAKLLNECLKFLVGELATRKELRARFKAGIAQL